MSAWTIHASFTSPNATGSPATTSMDIEMSAAIPSAKAAVAADEEKSVRAAMRNQKVSNHLGAVSPLSSPVSPSPLSSSSLSSSTSTSRPFLDSAMFVIVAVLFSVLGLIFSVGAAGASGDMSSWYKGTQIPWPSTISSMVRDTSDPAGRLFLAFEVIAAVLLLLSRFPVRMSVMPREQCTGSACRYIRLLMATLGLMVVGSVPTVDADSHSVDPDEYFLLIIHMLAAFAAFLVQPIAEIVALYPVVFSTSINLPKVCCQCMCPCCWKPSCSCAEPLEELFHPSGTAPTTTTTFFATAAPSVASATIANTTANTTAVSSDSTNTDTPGDEQKHVAAVSNDSLNIGEEEGGIIHRASTPCLAYLRFISSMLALLFFAAFIGVQIRMYPLSVQQWDGLNVISFVVECGCALSSSINLLAIATVLLRITQSPAANALRQAIVVANNAAQLLDSNRLVGNMNTVPHIVQTIVQKDNDSLSSSSSSFEPPVVMKPGFTEQPLAKVDNLSLAPPPYSAASI